MEHTRVVEWSGMTGGLEEAINEARERLERGTPLRYTFVQALPKEYDSLAMLLIFNLVQ